MPQQIRIKVTLEEPTRYGDPEELLSRDLVMSPEIVQSHPVLEAIASAVTLLVAEVVTDTIVKRPPDPVPQDEPAEAAVDASAV